MSDVTASAKVQQRLLQSRLLLDLINQDSGKQLVDSLLQGAALHMIAAQRWFWREMGACFLHPRANSINHYRELGAVPTATALIAEIERQPWVRRLAMMEDQIAAIAGPTEARVDVIASDAISSNSNPVRSATVYAALNYDDVDGIYRQLSDFIRLQRQNYAEF